MSINHGYFSCLCHPAEAKLLLLLLVKSPLHHWTLTNTGRPDPSRVVQGLKSRGSTRDGELVVFALQRLRFPGHQGEEARGTGLEMEYLSTGLSFPRQLYCLLAPCPVEDTSR